MTRHIGAFRIFLGHSCAFTLAEVLITLGIIGVVSAMTVPSLIHNYQRQSYVTQLHKVYNELQQAFLQEMNEANAINLKEAGMGVQSYIKTFLPKHFKIVQIGELDLKETPWGNTRHTKILTEQIMLIQATGAVEHVQL